MATKKDLVEAYSFSRRRLVTAFVSGAPGGREVEPSRPGRTLVGGVALAVLVAAGGAVAGILGSHQAVDWTKPALVSDKDTGADYVVLPPPEAAGDDVTDATGSTDGASSDAVLRPVANITSAMLLLGPDLDHEVVSGSDIASQRRGAPIGILQAPATPPETGSLIQSGWTACTGRDGTGTGGTRLDVSAAAGVTPAPSAAMVFRVGRSYFLVAEAAGGLETPRAYAYPVPENAVIDNVLQDVAQVTRRDAVKTTDDWISLFPAGPALVRGSFDVPALGDRVDYADELSGLGGRRPKVGDYYAVAGDDQLRVLLRDGVARLDPFAAAVYVDVFAGGAHRVAKLPTQDGDPAGGAPVAPYDADLWPVDRPDAPPAGQDCATLDAATGQLPGVRLGTLPSSSTSSASAASVPAGEHDVTVDSGHGAVVLSGGFGSDPAEDPAEANAQPVLVDDRGYAYRLDENAPAQLGYADVPGVVVPRSWLDLLNPGVPLSVNAARCPPTSGDEVKPCGR